MKEFDVSLTEAALGDLTELSEYIAMDSPDAAERVSADILSAIDSLAMLPQKFKQVGVTKIGKFPVHRLIKGSFLVYYRVETDAVYILMIRHERRRRPRRF